jgi:peptidyl-prolyl cis-trans isomerase C
MKTISSFSSILLTSVLIAVTGCKMPGDVSGRNQAKDPNDPVLAHVGQSEIRKSDYLAYLRMHRMNQSSAVTPQDRRQILQQLISQQTLVEQARQAGIDKTEEFQDRIRASENTLLAQLYLEKMSTHSQVTSAEARAYYDQHRDMYADGKLHISHIVCGSAAEAEKAEKMLQSGVAFGEVAIKLSRDRATAQNGGKMPPLSTGAVDPTVLRIARILKKGQVSGPITTKAGIEIIRKDDLITGSAKPFTSVEKDIMAVLKMQKTYQQVNETKIPVTIDSKQVDALQ